MKKRGFTLIELLVVVGVIAVLMAVALPNFMGARERAQDAKKKTELSELKSALRIWYNDYSMYPADTDNTTINGCGTGNPPASACTSALSTGSGATEVVYMKNLPDDYNGSTSGTGWRYAQVGTGDDFCLWTALDNRSDSEIARSKSKCSTGCSTLATGATDYVMCAD